jgi:hypothetical protein
MVALIANRYVPVSNLWRHLSQDAPEACCMKGNITLVASESTMSLSVPGMTKLESMYFRGIVCEPAPKFDPGSAC